MSKVLYVHPGDAKFAHQPGHAQNKARNTFSNYKWHKKRTASLVTCNVSFTCQRRARSSSRSAQKLHRIRIWTRENLANVSCVVGRGRCGLQSGIGTENKRKPRKRWCRRRKSLAYLRTAFLLKSEGVAPYQMARREKQQNDNTCQHW